jgi:hypothetical protein
MLKNDGDGDFIDITNKTCTKRRKLFLIKFLMGSSKVVTDFLKKRVFFWSLYARVMHPADYDGSSVF